MKKILTIITVFLSGTAMITAQNLLSNSDFETTSSYVTDGSFTALPRISSNTTTTPAGTYPTSGTTDVGAGVWLKKASASNLTKCAYVTTDFYTGGGSMNILEQSHASQPILADNWYALDCQQKVGATLSATKYYLTFWAKKDATAGNAATGKIYGYITSSEGTTKTGNITAGTNWAQYIISLDITTAGLTLNNCYAGVGLGNVTVANNYYGVLVDYITLALDAIQLTTQPAASTNVNQGAISGSLTTEGTTKNLAAVTYQWYRTSSPTANYGGTPVLDAISATFTIPTDLTAGTYYYYCVLSSASAAPQMTTVAAVTVNAPVSVSNSGFEDTPSNFTTTESGANVLYRVTGIQDVTTQTTSPAVASGASITSGMWVKKAPNTGYVKGVVISSDSHSGSSSLNFKIQNNYGSSGLELWSNSLVFQKLSLTNTQKYVISFWAKKDATANNQCSTVTVFLTDNTKKTLLSYAIPLTGGTTWTQYSATFDIPSFKSANATADFTTAYMGFGINTTYDANTLKTNYSGLIVDDFSINTTNTGTVTISTSANTGGSVTGMGAIYVSGTNATVLATATSGYRFVNWTEGGNPVSTNAAYTFTANANRTLVANFESVYTVAATAGTGGTMVSGSGTYVPNSNATVVASANSGYRFVNWTEGGNPVSTSATYTFTANANRTLVANFEAATTLSSGVTNVSSIIDNSIVTVASGAELTIDASKSLNSVTLSPGAKLTLSSGTLTATNGITLQSSTSGTATFVDNNNTSPQSVSGTVEQHLASARSWYLSSPIAGATIPSGQTYYSYDETGSNTGFVAPASLYWVAVPEGTTINPMKGYITQPGAATTKSYTGTFNTGTKTIALTRTNSAAKPGFNLVANPYPSYLDWSMVDTTAANIQTSVWYRTKTSGGAYTFDTYNGKLDVATANGENAVSKLIPPMQAFWVRVKTGFAGGTLTFDNTMRKHADVSGNKMKAPKVSETKVVRLQLSNGTNADEALVCFNSNAQNSFDSYDSPKMFESSATRPELYTLAGNEKVVINGLSDLNGLSSDMELPLGFTTGAGGNFTLKATEITNFDNSRKLYLRDKQENSETELTPETEYAFSTTAATSNNESRFSLLFKAPGVTTGTTNANSERISVFVNTQNQITIIAKPNSNYSIYNAMGQLIENGTLNSEFRTQNPKLAAGVYVVKVNNQSTRVVVK